MTGRIRRSLPGFTLIEMMIVLTIIAIMVSIGVPRFEAFNRMNRLKAGVRQVAMSIQNARLRAIGANRRCYIDFAPGTLTPEDRFFTIWLDVDGNQARDEGEIDSAKVGLPDLMDGLPGFRLPRGVGFGVSGISSGPEGMSVAADGVDFEGEDLLGFGASGEGTAAGVIYLNGEDGAAFAVAVSKLGRVRTYQWGGGQWR